MSLHSGSKQIKKPKRSIKDDEYSPSSPSDSADKKYKTYTKSQKLSIISDLKKALMSKTKNIKNSCDDLISNLESLSKAQYNQIIESILSSHAPSVLKYKGDKKQWQKELKQWRRQLKSWVKNIDKPETRGNARVIPHESETKFKHKITEILQSMPSRSFDLLREKVLAALKEMHENNNVEEEDPRCVVNESTFSKHFWYDYMRANPDVEELYSSLPIFRNVVKKNISKEDGPASQAKLTSPSETMFSSDEVTKGSESPEFDEGLLEGCSRYFVEEGLFSEDTCFSISQTTAITILPDEQKEEESREEFLSLDFGSPSDNKKPIFDFYKSSKMIVEEEDNETQRNFFKQFCLNGIEI